MTTKLEKWGTWNSRTNKGYITSKIIAFAGTDDARDQMCVGIQRGLFEELLKSRYAFDVFLQRSFGEESGSPRASLPGTGGRFVVSQHERTQGRPGWLVQPDRKVFERCKISNAAKLVFLLGGWAGRDRVEVATHFKILRSCRTSRQGPEVRSSGI